jgi:hypothetical protein
VRRLAAYLLLLAIAVVAAREGYLLSGVYRHFTDVGKRLPHLPVVRSATRQPTDRFPSKVWVHRVNSVERAVLIAKEYKGIEIDVVYDSSANYFDVGHPPVPSQGISLERMLSSVPDIASHYFWLDFKNLTDANKKAACALLLSIGRKYGVVSHMIVESTNPRALSCFTESGFYTSYYLFPEARLDTMSKEQVADYYEEVKSQLMASEVNALSSDYRSLPFIQTYFPDADVLLWYLKTDRRLRYYASLAYLRLNPRVKVILVERPGPGYR